MEWNEFLKQEESQAYYQALMAFLNQEYEINTIFPPREDLFSVFQYCSYDDVKVVVLGQDPYHKIHQAHGLAFSVRKGVKIPPSLRNIYKEAESDVGINPPSHGYLVDWAKQGVFMMNAIMSVEEGKAGSHRKKGWETFSDHVISLLNNHEQPLVFVLWGNWAQEKKKLITCSKHLILCAPHPSPLSAYQGFFGSKPFSQINAFLKEHGRDEIDWRISE